MGRSDWNFAQYQPATGCTDGSSPGAKALMAYLLDCEEATRSLGIWNCRDAVGQSIYSIHAEGRACDVGTPLLPNGQADRDLHLRLVNRIASHGAEIGLMGCIWNEGGSGRGTPMVARWGYAQGRKYTGVAPHKDHTHNELTRWGANHVTYAMLVDVCGVPDDTYVPPPPYVPPPIPIPLPPEELIVPVPITKESHPQVIGMLQDYINQAYYIPRGEAGLTITSPPAYGSGTEAAVRKWLVPQTGDTDPEVVAGRKVNFREWGELEVDRMQVRLGV